MQVAHNRTGTAKGDSMAVNLRHAARKPSAPVHALFYGVGFFAGAGAGAEGAAFGAGGAAEDAAPPFTG